MNNYIKLTISGTNSTINKFIDAVVFYVNDSWQFVERSTIDGINEKIVFVKTNSKSKSIPLTLVHMDESLFVANIGDCLGISEYNRNLEDFYDTVVVPNLNSNLKLDKTSGDVIVDGMMSSETYECLKRYCNSANVFNPHPLDDRRWDEFLISAFADDKQCTTDIIHRIIFEEFRKPEEFAEKLVLDYERCARLFDNEYINKYRSKSEDRLFDKFFKTHVSEKKSKLLNLPFPKKLYHYYSFDKNRFSISALEQRRIHLSSPDKLDDPFELVAPLESAISH